MKNFFSSVFLFWPLLSCKSKLLITCENIELCARNEKRGTASFIAFDIYTREGDTKGVAKSHVRTWGSCRGTSLGERHLESSQQLLTFHNRMNKSKTKKHALEHYRKGTRG
jgi:hypothetical protein